MALQTRSVGTTAMSEVGGTPAASPLNWAAVPSLRFLACLPPVCWEQCGDLALA